MYRSTIEQLQQEVLSLRTRLPDVTVENSVATTEQLWRLDVMLEKARDRICSLEHRIDVQNQIFTVGEF